MGLDVGDRRIGVAVSDELEIGAYGVVVIERSDPASDLARIQNLVSEYEAGKIIVGFPMMMDGSVGIQGEKVLKFVEALQQFVTVPVTLWDERLSTRAAEQVLLEANMRRSGRKKVIDRLAAAMILQNYLDSLV